MSNLTVYILEGDNESLRNVERIKESFINDPIFIEIKREQLPIARSSTKWYMYLFDNEWIDPSLAKYLHVWLEHDYFDYFVLWKIVQPKEGKMTRYVAPRIFRKGVRLGKDFLPINQAKLDYEKILDGWIMEDPRI